MPFPCRLKLSEEIRSLIQGLHPELKRKVRAALEQILQDPYSGKALRDDLEGLRSVRVGGFRIVYRASSRTIEIVAIGPRRNIYEDTLRIIRRERHE